MHRYIDVLKKYAVFEGRARRKDYWAFVLINIGIGTCVTFFSVVLAPGKAGYIRAAFDLAVLLPTAGVTIRRMHDVDRSGWWCLVPVIAFFLACREGTHGPNRFGDDVKAIEDGVGEAWVSRQV